MQNVLRRTFRPADHAQTPSHVKITLGTKDHFNALTRLDRGRG